MYHPTVALQRCTPATFGRGSSYLRATRSDPPHQTYKSSGVQPRRPALGPPPQAGAQGSSQQVSPMGRWQDPEPGCADGPGLLRDPLSRRKGGAPSTGLVRGLARVTRRNGGTQATHSSAHHRRPARTQPGCPAGMAENMDTMTRRSSRSMFRDWVSQRVTLQNKSTSPKFQQNKFQIP